MRVGITAKLMLVPAGLVCLALLACGLADLIVGAAEAMEQALRGLPDLKDVEKHCVEVNRLENAADDVYRQAISSLFTEERSATDILKWKEIYELLEAVTDRCEDVANVIESIALRHA